MIKPTKYKSITYAQAKAKEVVALSETKKQKVFDVLDTFIDLFKLKHL